MGGVNLEQWLEAGSLHKIDLLVVRHLQEKMGVKDAGLSFLLAHMQLSLRNGQPFIEIEDGRVIPDPQHLWTFENEKSPPCSFLELTRLIISGKSFLEVASHEKKFPPVVIEGTRLYFQKIWRIENQLQERVQSLNHAPLRSMLPLEKIEAKLTQWESEKIVLPEQKNAIAAAAKKTITFLAGGPGTGKTYTAGLLIRLILEELPEHALSHFRILLAAPTGKAAMNLQASLNRALQNSGVKIEQLSHPLEAKTLHSLLKTRSYGLFEEDLTPLAADLILVDEASMIDSAQMLALVQKIAPGTRLILIGDPNQLPPIEPGAPFQEWVERDNSLKTGSVCRLLTCQRAELQSIIQFASHLQAGNAQAAWEMIEDGSQGLGIGRFVGDENEVVNYAKKLFKEIGTLAHTPEMAYQASQNFRVLLPKAKGHFGVDALNQILFRDLITDHPKQTPFAAPIIATRNDYFYGLSNGETGIFVKCGKKRIPFEIEEEDYLLFPNQTGNSFKKLAAFLVPDFAFAYALTIHKSQGSEYGSILLLFPEGSEAFGKKALYTAATRAKKELLFWGEFNTFQKALFA